MDVLERIKAAVADRPIVLFMKGTPDYPMCGYSSRAVQALESTGAQYHAVNVLEDPSMRASLPQFGNWPTFPQLYVQGELIGGCDIIEDLKASGQLDRMVSDLAADAQA
jgi:monothiol glutaredoxin